MADNLRTSPGAMRPQHGLVFCVLYRSSACYLSMALHCIASERGTILVNAMNRASFSMCASKRNRFACVSAPCRIFCLLSDIVSGEKKHKFPGPHFGNGWLLTYCIATPQNEFFIGTLCLKWYCDRTARRTRRKAIIVVHGMIHMSLEYC